MPRSAKGRVGASVAAESVNHCDVGRQWRPGLEGRRTQLRGVGEDVHRVGTLHHEFLEGLAHLPAMCPSTTSSKRPSPGSIKPPQLPVSPPGSAPRRRDRGPPPERGLHVRDGGFKPHPPRGGIRRSLEGRAGELGHLPEDTHRRNAERQQRRREQKPAGALPDGPRAAGTPVAICLDEGD
jgi:hypothetical protein